MDPFGFAIDKEGIGALVWLVERSEAEDIHHGGRFKGRCGKAVRTRGHGVSGSTEYGVDANDPRGQLASLNAGEIQQ